MRKIGKKKNWGRENERKEWDGCLAYQLAS